MAKFVVDMKFDGVDLTNEEIADIIDSALSYYMEEGLVDVTCDKIAEVDEYGWDCIVQTLEE